MEKKEKLEALKLALTNEEKEKEFYLENAGRTADELGRRMFESIADDEAEHYRRLKALYENLEEREGWPEGFSTDISSSKVGEMIDRLIGEHRTAYGGDEEDVAAVKTAIEFETKGEEFYAGLAAGAGNEAEKRFFGLLSSMEREHRLSLEDTLEYFEDPKGWLERKGGRLLDGA